MKTAFLLRLWLPALLLSLLVWLVPPVRAVGNDNFADAWIISGMTYTTNVSNAGATRESGEPDHGYVPGGKSLWWRWTASTNLAVEITTTDSDFDTVLAVYLGADLSALTWVAYNDQAGGANNTSRIVFSARAGTTYDIAVDGWHGAAGQVVLRLGPAPAPPPNDNIADAALISVTNYSLITWNTNATGEPGEPNYSPAGNTHSLWWGWTAPGFGRVRVDTAGSRFDTTLARFSASVTNEAGIWDDDSGPGTTSQLEFEVDTGATYRFRVDGYDGATGQVQFNLRWSQYPIPPPNDDFANATLISGSAYTEYTANRGATKQTGETNHCGNAGGHSLWWRWTAPGDCQAYLATGDTLALAVYTNASLGALGLVANNRGSDSGHSGASDVTFQARAGVVYRIAVDGWDGWVGSVTLRLTTSLTPSGPPNDHFTNATVLIGTNLTAVAWDQDATREPGEPAHAGVNFGGSLWWRWTAPISAVFQVNTIGSEFPTALAVYTGGALGALTEVASDQGRAPKLRSRVLFYATAGFTYQIAVADGTANQYPPGGIELNLFPNLPLPPANDLFANATTINGPTFSVTASNAGATEEPGEPAHAGHVGGASLWWRWTAPASGSAQVDTVGSDFDTLLAIYTGSAVNALTLVAADDNGGLGLASELTFDATAGTAYAIAVDGLLGASGHIVLRLSGPVAVLLQEPALVMDNGGLRFQCRVLGPDGRAVILQAAAQLDSANWVSLQTNVLAGGSALLADRRTPVSGRQFYRALLVP